MHHWVKGHGMKVTSRRDIAEDENDDDFELNFSLKSTRFDVLRAARYYYKLIGHDIDNDIDNDKNNENNNDNDSDSDDNDSDDSSASHSSLISKVVVIIMMNFFVVLIKEL